MSLILNYVCLNIALTRYLTFLAKGKRSVSELNFERCVHKIDYVLKRNTFSKLFSKRRRYILHMKNSCFLNLKFNNVQTHQANTYRALQTFAKISILFFIQHTLNTFKVLKIAYFLFTVVLLIRFNVHIIFQSIEHLNLSNTSFY